ADSSPPGCAADSSPPGCAADSSPPGYARPIQVLWGAGEGHLADNGPVMNASVPALSPAERAELEAVLRTRQRELRADVAAKLRTQEDPRLVGLRNRMQDTDDWAAADAMAAHDIALVSRDLSELATVEQAL